MDHDLIKKDSKSQNSSDYVVVQRDQDYRSHDLYMSPAYLTDTFCRRLTEHTDCTE